MAEPRGYQNEAAVQVSMNAFTIAQQILGDRIADLSAGQLAQLRTIDHKFQQQVFNRLHRASEGDATNLRLTASDTAELKAMLERDILDMLTPEQRKALPVEMTVDLSRSARDQRGITG